MVRIGALSYPVAGQLPLTTPNRTSKPSAPEQSSSLRQRVNARAILCFLAMTACAIGTVVLLTYQVSVVAVGASAFTTLFFASVGWDSVFKKDYQTSKDLKPTQKKEVRGVFSDKPLPIKQIIKKKKITNPHASPFYRSFLYLLFALGGATLSIQIPQFIEKYLEHIRGRIGGYATITWENVLPGALKFLNDYSNYSVEIVSPLPETLKTFLLQRIPESFQNKDPQQLIQSFETHINYFINHSDQPIIDEGMQKMQNLLDFQLLTEDCQLIESAAPFSRPFHFFYRVNGKIFKKVYEKFTPGFSMNRETVLYGLVGALTGCVLCYTLSRLISYTVRKIRSNPSS